MVATYLYHCNAHSPTGEAAYHRYQSYPYPPHRYHTHVPYHRCRTHPTRATTGIINPHLPKVPHPTVQCSFPTEEAAYHRYNTPIYHRYHTRAPYHRYRTHPHEKHHRWNTSTSTKGTKQNTAMLIFHQERLHTIGTKHLSIS